jgi:hypothetical protein
MMRKLASCDLGGGPTNQDLPRRDNLGRGVQGDKKSEQSCPAFQVDFVFGDTI